MEFYPYHPFAMDSATQALLNDNHKVSVPPKMWDCMDEYPTPDILFNHFNKEYANPTGRYNELGMEIWQDVINTSVFYNQIYYTSISSGCMPFIIVKKLPKKNFNTGKINMVYRLQMLKTLICLNTKYYTFEIPWSAIRDPFLYTEAGGHACLGNIDIAKLGVPDQGYENYKNGVIMYNIWTEIMRRCYDQTNPYYKFYGAEGLEPLRLHWRCFRTFYIAFDDWYNGIDNLYPNPNDCALYDDHRRAKLRKETTRDMPRFDNGETNAVQVPEWMRSIPVHLRNRLVYQEPLNGGLRPAENISMAGVKPMYREAAYDAYVHGKNFSPRFMIQKPSKREKPENMVHFYQLV